MTLGEFMAWLEGFSCSFTVTTPADPDERDPDREGFAPDAEQWKDIVRKLESITLLSLPPDPYPMDPGRYTAPRYPQTSAGWPLPPAATSNANVARQGATDPGYPTPGRGAWSNNPSAARVPEPPRVVQNQTIHEPAPRVMNPMAAGTYLGLQDHLATSPLVLDREAFLRDNLTDTASSHDEKNVAALAEAIEAGDEESFAAIKARIDDKQRASG